MPKPKHQRFPRTPFFLLTALGTLLYASAEAQQSPTVGSPPPPLPISSLPAAPATCDNPVNVPFAGVFVAAYTKDSNEIKNLDDTLAKLAEPEQDPFHLKIGNSAIRRINGNYFSDDLLLKVAYKSPCQESCDERNKRIKEIDSKAAAKDIENYLINKFGNNCIDALKLSECKQGYTEKCLTEIREQCGPCQTRQDALRNLAHEKISGVAKKGQPFLLVSIYFKANEKGEYPYVIQRFWPKIEQQEEKPPIVSQLLYMEGCSGKPDKCCLIKLLNQAITEATPKPLPPRKEVVSNPEKPPSDGPIKDSTLGAGPDKDKAAQPTQPVGATGQPSLLRSRSAAMRIALATLGIGLVGSTGALVGLGVVNSDADRLAKVGLGPIDLGYHCGTRMDMSCGSIQPNLNLEVRIFAGLTGFFAAGLATTLIVEGVLYRKMVRTAEASAAPVSAKRPPVEASTTGATSTVLPSVKPTSTRDTPSRSPSAAPNPAPPPPASGNAAPKAPPQPPPQALLL